MMAASEGSYDTRGAEDADKHGLAWEWMPHYKARTQA